VHQNNKAITNQYVNYCPQNLLLLKAQYTNKCDSNDYWTTKSPIHLQQRAVQHVTSALVIRQHAAN